MNYKDYDALSSKKRLRIFNELGVPANSLENVIGFFRKADSEYPDTHTSNEPPTLNIDSFEMEDSRLRLTGLKRLDAHYKKKPRSL